MSSLHEIKELDPDPSASAEQERSYPYFRDKPEYFRRATSSLRAGGRLLLTAWTGSMHSPRVSAVARAFVCPSLQSVEDYERQIKHAGLRILSCEEISGQVVRTWEICLKRARKLRALIRIFPREVCEFVDGISTIREAYQSRDLTYSVIVAEK